MLNLKHLKLITGSQAIPSCHMLLVQLGFEKYTYTELLE